MITLALIIALPFVFFGGCWWGYGKAMNDVRKAIAAESPWRVK